MAELGSGNGSDYPSSLDTDNVLEVDGSTLQRADVPNDSNAAIVAIEGELGTTPSGTKSDVKAYLQTEHETDGTHGAITATSVASAGAVSGTTGTFSGGTKTDGTNTLKTKILDIGDWDMDADATVSVAHGVTYANIRHISAMLRNDADTGKYPVGQIDIGVAGLEIYFDTVTSTNVVLARQTGGPFDSTDFDSTSYNRGWITIIYTA
jgi:hypothetical protein